MPCRFPSVSLPFFAASIALAGAPSAYAAIVTTNSSAIANIQSSGASSGASAVSVAGTSFNPSFAVLDFSTASLGFTDQTRASSINSISLSLTDINTNPAYASGIVDVYLSNNSVPTSNLLFQPSSPPQGIGSQLNTLTQVANIDLSTTAGQGTSFNPNLTLTSDTSSYILNQLNLGNPIRVVLAPDSADVNASFEGSNGNLSNNPPLPAPQLKINVNTATRIPGDANGDGAVDIRDLQIIANHWQANVYGPANGDFNDSGKVDIIDLQTLANNWQVGVGGSGSSLLRLNAFSAHLASAPEPASLPLFLFALVLPLLSYRAHHSRHICR